MSSKLHDGRNFPAVVAVMLLCFQTRVFMAIPPCMLLTSCANSIQTLTVKNRTIERDHCSLTFKAEINVSVQDIYRHAGQGKGILHRSSARLRPLMWLVNRMISNLSRSAFYRHSKVKTILPFLHNAVQCNNGCHCSFFSFSIFC